MKLDQFIEESLILSMRGFDKVNENSNEFQLDQISYDIYVDDDCNVGGQNKITFTVTIGDKIDGK